MYSRVLGSFQEQDVAAAKESYSKQGYSDFSETVLPSGKISLEGKKSIDLNSYEQKLINEFIVTNIIYLLIQKRLRLQKKLLVKIKSNIKIS
jgi:large-conductance mechanosensitive channel